ncbi:hypothetical protein [Flindersiella endophytica]
MEVLRGVLIGLVLAEFAFVAGFVLVEAVSLVLLRWTTKVDRRAQALSNQQYAAWFAIPMVTAGCGVGIAIGVNLITGEGNLSYSGGLVIVFGSLILFGYVLLGYATGHLPRTHFRARVRRRLAETGERLGSTTQVSRADAEPLRDRLRRMEKVGGRLSDRAATEGWRISIRNERTWLVLVVAAAFVLPISGVVGVAVLRGPGDLEPDRLEAVGLLLTLSMATAAAVVMRRIRLRWELHELGEELRTGSAALLEQLAELTEPEPVPNRPSLPSRLLSRLGFRRRSG